MIETGNVMDVITGSVMLIDDSTIDNFVSQKVIERCGFSSNVAPYTKARKALDHLATLKPGDDVPEIIFLDMNMPVMNGFQFLAEYNRLGSHVKDNCKIVILSSSINPAEVSLAMQNHNVFAFFSKPLMKHNLDRLQEMLSGEREMAY